MKNLRVTLLLITFALILSLAHMVWNHMTGPVAHEDAKAGELTLDEALIKENKMIDLNGEWAFYPNELLTPEEVATRDKKSLINVPESWQVNQKDESFARGFGTYHLRIPAKALEGEILGLRVNKINVAYKLYVNGELIQQLGKVSRFESDAVAERRPVEVNFASTEPTIDLVIQVSNYTYDTVGGIVNSLLFGTDEAIQHYFFYNKMFQIMLGLILFMYAIYSFLAGMIGISHKQSYFFGLILLLVIVSIYVSDDYLILNVIDLSYESLTRLSDFIYSGLMWLVMLLIVSNLIMNNKARLLMRTSLSILGIILVLQLFLPVNLLRDYVVLYYIPWVITSGFILYQLIKQVRYTKRINVILIALSLISIITSSVWGGIKHAYVLNILYYPFDILIAASIYGGYLTYRVWEVYKHNEQMKNALLQAQIQPHFIFNTLNSIISLSYIDQERMVKLVRNFSTYLRFSFKEVNLNRLVTLREELDIVKAYIHIQQERFGDQIKLEWDVDDSVNHVMIPPLTIQPLVENVITHGILHDYEPGLLQLIVKKEADAVYIEVSDDGPGVTKEQANALLNHRVDSSGGIGLKNTHERLRQMYQMGLTIESEPGKGFTVWFRIPDKNN